METREKNVEAVKEVEELVFDFFADCEIHPVSTGRNNLNLRRSAAVLSNLLVRGKVTIEDGDMWEEICTLLADIIDVDEYDLMDWAEDYVPSKGYDL